MLHNSKSGNAKDRTAGYIATGISKSRFGSLPKMHESEVGRPHNVRRLKNAGVQGQLDVRVEPIYDYWRVLAATALRTETLFTKPQGTPYTPQGGTTITLTQFHTTMVQSGVMDAPKKMLVKALSFIPWPNTNITDLNNILIQYLVTFSTLQKQFWQGMPMMLPAGGGPFIGGVGSLTAPASSIGTANGWPDAHNLALITDDVPDIPGYTPPPPITGVLLETSQPFNVVIDPTQTGSAVYTTDTTTGVVVGVPGVGVQAHFYLNGLTLVAVV